MVPVEAQEAQEAQEALQVPLGRPDLRGLQGQVRLEVVVVLGLPGG